MAKKDENKNQQQDKQEQQTVEQRKDELKNPSGLNSDFDGAAREALAIQRGHNRAAGANINEDYLALTEEEAKEKGYLGYSPVGPGENDGIGQNNRLGTLGDFGEE